MPARLPPLCIYGIYFWPPHHIPLTYILKGSSWKVRYHTYYSPEPTKKPTKFTHETQKSHMKSAQIIHKNRTQNHTWNSRKNHTERLVSLYIRIGFIKGSTTPEGTHFCVYQKPLVFRRQLSVNGIPWQYVPILAFLFVLLTLLVIPFPYAIVGTHTPKKFSNPTGGGTYLHRPRSKGEL